MKTTITSVSLAAAVLVLVSCAAPKAYLSFLDWDANHTGSIERQEFVQAHTDQDYIKKWSSDKHSIDHAEMQQRIFTSLDSDGNFQLDRAEFDGKMARDPTHLCWAQVKKNSYDRPARFVIKSGLNPY